MLFLGIPAYPQDPSRLIALAADHRLSLMIGKFDAKDHRWVTSDHFYQPPEPGDVFTLYDPSGQLGPVTISDKERAVPDATFEVWTADIHPWDRSIPMAIAISGEPPLPVNPLEPIALDNPEAVAEVSRYLKTKRLPVERPRLTQALAMRMNDDSSRALLLVAQSDPKTVTENQEAAIYSVALLVYSDKGKAKILALGSQTSWKPAKQSLEDHLQHYGTQDRFQIIAALNIDERDGPEILLYRATEDAKEASAFSFDGQRLKKVLSTQRFGFN